MFAILTSVLVTQRGQGLPWRWWPRGHGQDIAWRKVKVAKGRSVDTRTSKIRKRNPAGKVVGNRQRRRKSGTE